LAADARAGGRASAEDAGLHARPFPALPVELGGLGVVEEDVRRPTARWRRLKPLARLSSEPCTVDVIGLVCAPGAHVDHCAVLLAHLNAGGVDVECPGAVLQDVGRDGPGEGLAGNHYGFVTGF